MGIAQKNNAQVYKHIGPIPTYDLFKSNTSIDLLLYSAIKGMYSILIN